MGRKRPRNKAKSKKPKEIQQLLPRLDNGMLPFDDISYGNPSGGYSVLTNTEHPTDYFTRQNLTNPFPANSSEETVSELVLINKLMSKANKELTKEARGIDTHLDKWLISKYEALGLTFNKKLWDKMVEYVEPIIIKLKFFYNRPRPYQLGYYYDIDIYPFPSFSAFTPAYPSGHTLQAKLINDIHIFYFPPFKEDLEILTKVVAKSRLVMGVHYPSDNQFSYELGEDLKKDEKFREQFYI